MQHHVCSAFNEVTCTRARKRSGLKGRGENARAIRSFCVVRLLAGRTSRACVEPQMCGMERVPRALYGKAEQRRSNQAVSHWLFLHFCTLAPPHDRRRFENTNPSDNRKRPIALRLPSLQHQPAPIQRACQQGCFCRARKRQQRSHQQVS